MNIPKTIGYTPWIYRKTEDICHEYTKKQRNKIYRKTEDILHENAKKNGGYNPKTETIHHEYTETLNIPK